MKIPLIYYRLRLHRPVEYVRAAWNNPEGMICHWCHRPNFFFDDVGFFCIAPYKNPNGGGLTRNDEQGICCERCYHGPLGTAHIDRFGVGER